MTLFLPNSIFAVLAKEAVTREKWHFFFVNGIFSHDRESTNYNDYNRNLVIMTPKAKASPY